MSLFPKTTSPGELETLLAAIVSSSDDAILLKDLDGIVRSWNPAAERIFGYAPEEIIGRPVTVLFPQDRLAEELETMARLHQGERLDHVRTVRLHRDGHPVAVSVTISPIRNAGGQIVGACKVCRDISAQSALEGMYKAIVSSSDDAIISKDLNGIVQSWNPSATRIFGYTEEEMVGRPITVLFPRDRLDEEPRILEQLRRGQRVDHFETVRIRKDGRQIEVSVTISPVRDTTGRVIGVSKVARDITGIKRHLREREALLARETAARAEAERAGRMKDDFLSTLSHDLRSPLSAILGWANMLRSSDDRVDEEELREGLETIERSARSQARLIDELLDMSRIINGKLGLELQEIDPVPVITGAIESVRPAAEARGIRITPLLDPNFCRVSGDPNRLQQVLRNLLSNAVKFTPPGGRVQVLLQRVNSHVEITVADTGQGIPPEFLPQLFHRFTQAETDTARRHGGLGLGLAIVKSIVELHGGTVTAASPGTGQGSTFTVTLPLAAVRGPFPAPAVHPQADPPVSELFDAPKLEGFRVLVVDDEPDDRKMMRRILERCHVTVTTAANAAKAVEILRRDRPHLLLSDVGMPDQDGYDLLRTVRALPPEEGGDTPAVAVTAFARSEDRRRALLAGFEMHLPKPIEPVELITILTHQYSARRRAGPRV
ncbi:MAG: PAS domain S-box protein [Verrucomicrobiaceae bacterium]|nr:MAG: PAS domain S-box protein [Verrucomicrobiaceae bacterium]